MGAGMVPARLEIAQRGNSLDIKTTRVVEYADDQVVDEKLTLDGTESKSEFMNSRVSRRRGLRTEGTGS